MPIRQASPIAVIAASQISNAATTVSPPNARSARLSSTTVRRELGTRWRCNGHANGDGFVGQQGEASERGQVPETLRHRTLPVDGDDLHAAQSERGGPDGAEPPHADHDPDQQPVEEPVSRSSVHSPGHGRLRPRFSAEDASRAQAETRSRWCGRYRPGPSPTMMASPRSAALSQT